MKTLEPTGRCASTWMLAALALAACGSNSYRPASGETHFLSGCSDDAACADGLSCACGVCTRACSGDSSCGELDPEASCQSTTAWDGCGGQLPARACNLPCDDGRDACQPVPADREQSTCEGAACDAAGAEPDAGTETGAGSGEASGADAAHYRFGECFWAAILDPVDPLDSLPEAAWRSAAVVLAEVVAARDGRTYLVESGDPSALYTVVLELEVEETLEGAAPDRVYLEMMRNGPGFMQGFDPLACWQRAAVGTRVLVFLVPDDPLIGGGFGEVFGEGDGLPEGEMLYQSLLTEGFVYELDGEVVGPRETRLSWLSGFSSLDELAAELRGRCGFGNTFYENGEELAADACNTCACNDGILNCTSAGCIGDVGARCATDGECVLGLECRSDLWGERGLCTRDCGDGCPEGTACVSGLPDYNGEPLPDLCMLACDVSGDCPGSECDMPGGVSERYCL